MRPPTIQHNVTAIDTVLSLKLEKCAQSGRFRWTTHLMKPKKNNTERLPRKSMWNTKPFIIAIKSTSRRIWQFSFNNFHSHINSFWLYTLKYAISVQFNNKINQKPTSFWMIEIFPCRFDVRPCRAFHFACGDWKSNTLSRVRARTLAIRKNATEKKR